MTEQSHKYWASVVIKSVFIAAMLAIIFLEPQHYYFAVACFVYAAL